MSHHSVARKCLRQYRANWNRSCPPFVGEGYQLYKTRRITFVFSFIGHVAVIAILLTSGQYGVSHRREIRRQVIDVITDVSPYVLPFELTENVAREHT